MGKNLTGEVRDICRVPNRDELVVAMRDGRLIVIDEKTGQSRNLSFVVNGLNCVACSTESGLIAAGGRGGSVYFWETKALMNSNGFEDEHRAAASAPFQEADWSLRIHESEINQICFSPDGKALLTCGDDAKIGYVDIDSMEIEFFPMFHTREIEQIAINFDGSSIAASASDGICSVWDVSNRKLLNQLNPDVSGRFTCVAWSPDGQYVAFGGTSGHIFVWRAMDDNHDFSQTHDPVESIEFVMDPLRVVSGDRSGVSRLWGLVETEDRRIDLSPQPQLSWKLHDSFIQALSYAHQSQSIISGGKDGMLKSMNLHGNDLSDFSTTAEDGCFSTQGNLLVCGSSVRIFSTQNFQLLDEILPTTTPWNLMDSATARERFVVASDDRVVVYDLDSEQEVFNRSIDRDLYRLALSPDGEFVALTWYDDPRTTVEIWSVVNSEEDRAISVRQCSVLSFSGDGKLLAAGEMDDLLLFNFPTLTLKQRLMGHTSTLAACDFHPNGRIVASGSHDRLICTWDVETGEKLHSIRAHQEEVRGISFLPNGLEMISAAWDGEATIWHTETLQPIADVIAVTGIPHSSKIETSLDGLSVLIRRRTKVEKIEVYTIPAN